MPRAPGRLVADGDRATAEVLVEALRAPQQDRDTGESLTHPFHTYPARMHPHVARQQAMRFRRHNVEQLELMAPHLGDINTLIAMSKQGRQQFDALWAQEREEAAKRKGAWQEPVSGGE